MVKTPMIKVLAKKHKSIDITSTMINYGLIKSIYLCSHICALSTELKVRARIGNFAPGYGMVGKLKQISIIPHNLARSKSLSYYK